MLAKALRESGELLTAGNLFVLMAKIGITPNPSVYSCLVGGHYKLGNMLVERKGEIESLPEHWHI